MIHKNIPLLYVYSVLVKRPTMPIIIVYFLLFNLSYTEIGVLGAAMALLHLVTEVHGGAFADRYGKKTSLTLHTVFGFLTMLFYFIGDSFSWFLIASIMYGIGGAFITGTKSSMLYDTLKSIKKEDQFKKYNGKVLLYSHLVNAAVLLVIPVLYTFNVKLPFLIGMLFFVSAFIVSLFFAEPFVLVRSGTMNSHILETVKGIMKHPRTWSFVLLSAFFMSLLWSQTQFNQPLLLISGLDIIYFGVIYALIRALAGLGAMLSHKAEKYFSPTILVVISCAGVVASFLCYSLLAGFALIAAILLLRVAEGFGRVVMEDELNKTIGSKNRTTVLSITNLVQQIFIALFVFLLGFFADIIGIQAAFGFAAVFVCVSFIFALSFLPWRHPK